MKTAVTKLFPLTVSLIPFLGHAPELGAASAATVPNMITKGNLTGGLVAQIGVSDPLLLKKLGERFHVRQFAPDAKSAEAALRRIAACGLQGRFTVDVAPTGQLPFVDRVLNALVILDDNGASETERRRVLAPRGLLIEWNNYTWTATAEAVPPGIDDWTHYLYDASGNAVSKDEEVATPRSFRWYAPPKHLRSHNYKRSRVGGGLAHFSASTAYRQN